MDDDDCECTTWSCHEKRIQKKLFWDELEERSKERELKSKMTPEELKEYEYINEE